MKNVDLIVRNAKVYTVDSAFQVVTSFAVDKGKFIFVGSESDLNAQFSSENVIDAKNKPIYPGFIDAHCHFFGYGVGLATYANLVGTNSFEDVIVKLKVFEKSHPNSEWLLGRGWDQNDWKDQDFPTNHLLNEAFPNKKVYLTRIDGHAAIVNDMALKTAQLTENIKISGGEIVVKNGIPTGLLIDNAMDLVKNLIPNADLDTKIQGLLEGQTNCFEVGLTAVHDAGLDKSDILILDSLQQSGDLKMNTYVMLSPTKANFDYFMNKGIYQTEKMLIRSIKLYADGALGSRGAKLIAPYSDDPDNLGLLLTPEDELFRLSKKANQAGYQVCTHAIGDRGNQIVLDIYAQLLKTKNDKRWRVEHAQVIDKNDFDKFGRYSIVPSVQPTHATSDMYWAEERLGDRVKYAYAYQNLLHQNGWIPLGSDFPVEDINPLFGFYAATVRKDQKGYPDKGFQLENAISKKDALKGMTIWAAKSAFQEDIMGSIEVGKLANFVILDQDIMDSNLMDTYKISVLATYIDGKNVFLKKK